MSLEELDNLDTPPINTVDEFEAALAVSAEAPVIDVAVVPDQVESEEEEEEENDENAEFRRALRTALGDWYVVHSYAGYEKKVKGNLG
jgi:hypothetical protein